MLFFFSTYSKASVSLPLEDASRYLQRRYIEIQLPALNLQKGSVQFKDKRPRVVQYSAVVCV